ncbi:hypothetical protein niasHS_008822 [Heterodera schachtii]|uniref:Uncharacterized protein n=1 Tax=Heterodera schachtii TaxID=97005 RepID=A0ABD2J217_HETSC
MQKYLPFSAIIGRLINGAAPNPITLYFNTSKSVDHRHLIIGMCVEPKSANGKMTICYDGLMDPANYDLNSQFHIENLEDNEIAKRCQASKKNWKAFGNKVLHGFELEYDKERFKLRMSTSYNQKRSNLCAELRLTHSNLSTQYAYCTKDLVLGEFGYLDGYLDGERKAENETFRHRAWYGPLLVMEDGIIALPYDLMAGMPARGGMLGIISDGVEIMVVLKGEGLAKCMGKKCSRIDCPHGYKSETENTETDLGQQQCSVLHDEKLVKHECYMLNCSDVLQSTPGAGQKPNFFEMDGLQGFKCSCIFGTEFGADTHQTSISPAVTTPPSPTTIHPETSKTTLLPNTSSDTSLAVVSHRVGNLVMFLAIP